MSSDSPKKSIAKNDIGRYIGSIFYFGAAIILFTVTVFLYLKVEANPPALVYYVRAWLWCISTTFFGFSAIAYRSSKKNHETPAWPYYATSYLLALLLAASLTAGIVLLVAEEELGIFLLISTPVSFAIGFGVDTILKKPLSMIDGLWN